MLILMALYLGVSNILASLDCVTSELLYLAVIVISIDAIKEALYCCAG